MSLCYCHVACGSTGNWQLGPCTVACSVQPKWATHGSNKATHLVCKPGYFGGQYQHVDMLGGLIVHTVCTTRYCESQWLVADRCNDYEQGWVEQCFEQHKLLDESLFIHSPDYVAPIAPVASPPKPSNPVTTTSTTACTTSSAHDSSSSSPSSACTSTTATAKKAIADPLPSYFTGVYGHLSF
jgi:hypothetical protein